jgi:hypothetical protein
MGRPQIRSNPKTQALFDDLDEFLRFCREYGYRYDERDLHNWKSYAYQQFNKFLQGKPAKNMWLIDSARRR